MTDNEILARWQGWSQVIGIPDHQQARWSTGRGKMRILPDYLNNDAAAMSLLDTLVEKGYAVDMASRGHKWDIGIARNDCNLDYCISMTESTRREAVVAACLELIVKEDV